jgi:hypothetical protein
MRKQIIENAAFEVATQVRTVEDSIEQALTDIAELQGRMLRARAVAGVSTATGHAAFEQLGFALQSLISARGGMAQCHGALKDSQKLVPGLRTVSFGEGSECPPKQATALPALRVVA